MTSTLLSRLNDPEQREEALAESQSMAYVANEHGWAVIDDLYAALIAAWAREQGWRCFHCGEFFTEERCARDHFGLHEGRDAACILVGPDRSLLHCLREAEDEAERAWTAMHEETTDVHKRMYSQSCRHRQALQAAEEAGYAKGLKDATEMSK